MNRYVKWLPLVFAVLILGAGGSLWAHQVIAENLAHSSYTGAVTALRGDIVSARGDGLYASELSAYWRGLGAIQSKQPPADGTFWSGNRESFYSTETIHLRDLDNQLRA